MRYISTRSKSEPASLSDAISGSLCSDGGLYVPEVFPHLAPDIFRSKSTICAVGEVLLKPFFEGDPLAGELEKIFQESFNFEVPLKFVSPNISLLELFHGPTQSFKDFGARFLASCLKRIPYSKPRLILVATSGDTGGAVASAFEGLKNHQVALLFPDQGISPRQRQQLTCWGDNVKSFAVQGSFDDCQKMVKDVFLQPSLLSDFSLTSSNSINLGRLLPQMVYYAWASLEHFRKTGNAANFVIPSGNVGNATACFWARRVGLPIKQIRMAFNSNATVTEYFKSGQYKPMNSKKTLANAMDVGSPSNFERITNLLPDLNVLKSSSSTSNTSDADIKKTIIAVKSKFSLTICPHTACGFHSIANDTFNHWIAVATAHPAKFSEVVEPLIGQSIEIPPPLNALLSRKTHQDVIPPDTLALVSSLKGN